LFDERVENDDAGRGRVAGSVLAVLRVEIILIQHAIRKVSGIEKFDMCVCGIANDMIDGKN
jgi:hypothetical protein